MNYKSLVEMIKDKSEIYDKGITFVKNETNDVFVSYNKLYKNALKVLYYLQERGVKAREFLVFQIEDEEDFLYTYWACILGQIIPVPIPLCNNEQVNRLVKVLNILDKPHLIGDFEEIEDLKKFTLVKKLERKVKDALENAISIPNVNSIESEGIIECPKWEDLALIQFSSGSTSDPKGVMLSHKNIITNLNDLIKRLKITENDSAVSWIPLTHDMGLICIHMKYLSLGANLVIMKPSLFTSNPVLWMDKTSEYKISRLYTPNFGFKLFLSAFDNKVERKWDLSNVSMIASGAEPISAEVFRAFENSLKPYGLKEKVMNTGYGLAEATVYVSGGNVGENVTLYVDRRSLGMGEKLKFVEKDDPQCISLIDVGAPVDSCKIRICNEKDEILEDGTVGRVQLFGDTITQGYYKNEELNAKLFSKDGWLNTGDLGFLLNNLLTIVGREKDVIIINGQNFYSHDIERSIESVKGVVPGRVVVCGILNDDTKKEDVIVFLRDEKANLPLHLEIKKYINISMGIDVKDIITISKIPKTESGKVKRFQLIDQYKSGKYSKEIEEFHLFIKESMKNRNIIKAENEIQEVLVNFISDILEVPKISIDDNFFELGGDSLKASKVIQMISKRFNVDISMRNMFAKKTIRNIAKYIEELDKSSLMKIGKVEESNYYEVSSAQKRIFVLNQMNPDDLSYNLTRAFVLDGNLKEELVQQTANKLIERHEIFRTSFNMVDGEVVQVVNQNVDFKIEKKRCKEEEVDYVINNFVRPFDLNSAPLIRMCLIELSNNKYVLVFDIHHIIFDGSSFEILMSDFTKLYDNKVLPKVNVTYKDFSVWQNKFFKSEGLKKQEEYWLNLLKDNIPVLNMPTDYSRPSVQSFEGDSIKFALDKADTLKLKQLCKETDSTLYMVLMAAYDILISKYTGQSDIIVGSPIQGRKSMDLWNVIGMFVNTLVMKNTVDDNNSFIELLERTKENTINAIENQDYQFDELVEKLKITREMSRNPIFDIMFVLQNIDTSSMKLEGIEISEFEYKSKKAQFDMLLEAIEGEEKINFTLEYCVKLFKRETMERFVAHYKNIIKEIIKNPNIKVSEISMMTKEERMQILFDFNDNIVDFNNSDKTVVDLFEEQVKRLPNKVAVKYKDSTLTYSQLDEYANKLSANLINNYHVKENDIIPIMVDPCLEMIIAVFAVLKSGCAYLPMDPSYPNERISYILKDSNAKIIIAQEKFEDRIRDMAENDIKFLDVDNKKSFMEEALISRPKIKPNNLVYVIYTSGSTGKPKGVLIEHKALLNFCSWYNSYYGVTSKDISTKYVGFGFDVTAMEIYTFLIAGAELHVIDKDIRLDIDKLVKYFEENKITISVLPTQVGEQFMMQSKYSPSRTLIVAGERLTSFVERGYTLANNYGPTENTVITTSFIVDKYYNNIPIGKPISNCRAYIVDKNDKLLPIGIVGELCVSGSNLAKGYLNLPKLTSEKFIDNPFEPNQKLYRTGDLARWLPDGNIEYVGRIDEQVKIRGYRIEIGEIESQILSYYKVSEAVVNIRTIANNKYICAYVVAESDFEVSELKSYLSKNLPDYMIPTYIMKIESMPLTSNGKCDKKKLENIELSRECVSSYEKPRNELEKKLIEIWETELGIKNIGINDNFFELGGNSISMMRISAKISEELKLSVSYQDFIEKKTISKIATCMDENVINVDNIYPLKEADNEKLLEPFPITDVQMAYLAGREDLYELGGISTHGYIEVEVDVDINLVNECVNKLIDRHPMLRAIILQGGQQRILENCTFKIKTEDLSGFELEDKDKVILKERNRMLNNVFAADKWPLFDAVAFKLNKENNKYCICISYDPLIADSGSIQIISKELISLYKNPGLVLEKIDFTFRDYMMAYSEFKNSPTYNKDKEYWLEKVADFSQAPAIPLKQSPALIRKPKIKSFREIIDEELWNKIKEKSKENNVTASAVLCAAYAKVLAFWSNQVDLAINLTVFNRYPFNPEVNKIVGDFTSVALLDINYKPDSTFWDFTKSVQAVLIETLEHRHYDGVEFIRDIAKYNNQETKAIMPIVFTSLLFNDNSGEEWIDFSKVKELITRTSQVYIDNQVLEANGKLIITWDYVEDLFDDEVIDSMFNQYVKIIEGITESVEDQKLTISNSDCNKIEKYNETDGYVSEDTLHSLFTKQANITPNKEAVIFEDEYITYKELDEKSNQVARYLIENGVSRNDKICLVTERRINTIVNMLGILKAGGCYIPIDPNYPDERKEYIFENSKCKMRLTEDFYEVNDISRYSVDRIEGKSSSTDDAYIIYTSGSTGKPKGVLISHQAAVNTILDINNKFDVNESDRIIGLSSMCFDLSVYDIFGALTSGAALVLIKDQRDVADIYRIIKEKNITIWNSVPAIMEMLIMNLEEKDEDISYWSRTESAVEFDDIDLRLVLLSGDWIPLKLPTRIKNEFNQAQVISLGGATEAAIWSIYYPIEDIDDKWSSIPYGYPLTNQKWYVLDYEEEMCPLNVVGELYIGGLGVAKGYENDREKTENAFIDHPKLGRIYKTGDYGKMTSNGYIEFCGRKDNQVKIIGYRIELGEIENRIREHKDIKNAVVIDRENNNGQKYLCAYIVTEKDVDNSELRDFLAETLPAYMIPQYFVNIDKIPLTDNGKVARKLLPLPDLNKCIEKRYVAPRNEIEEKVASIWKQVLKIDRIGVLDNFLEVGGNSILMVQIVNKLTSIFNVRISLREFIDRSSIAKLAEYISKNKNSGSNEQKALYVAVTSDEENIHKPFQLTEVQTAYFMGRNKVFEMGGTSTHGYSEFETKLDMTRLNIGLNKLIERHPMLRAIVLPIGKQKILDEVPTYKIDIVDISDKDSKEQEKLILKERDRMSHYIFKTDEWPLFEFKAFKISEDTHYLFMGFDLLIADGASMVIFGKELMEFYNNIELVKPPINFTFRDYLIALEEFKKSDAYVEDKKYWISKLDDFPQAPALPLKQDPANVSVPHFKRHSKVFSKEEWELIKKKAQEKNITPSALLGTAFAQVLSFWSGQSKLAINMTVFNRYPFHENVNSIIGDFTSIMLIGLDFEGKNSFWEKANHVQDSLIEALEHRNYDGMNFIREIAKKENIGTKAVMPIVFTSMLFGDTAGDGNSDLQIGETKMRVSQTSQVYIDYQVMEVDNGGLCISWDYVDELFEKHVIDSMFKEYIDIVESILRDKVIDSLRVEENDLRMIEEYNNCINDKYSNKILHKLFIEQAKITPEKDAVVLDEKHISYKELDEKSNQIAHYLVDNGVNTGDFVSVICYRDIRTIINILGVLKAGATYIPLDPSYPDDRKKYINENSKCKFVLKPETYEEKNINLLSIDLVETYCTSENNAYVIYTSGSTGRPKGVVITHGAVCNTILDINNKFNVNENDRIIGISSMCFDLSVYDIFGALCSGATLVMVKDQRDVVNLLEVINKEEITIWNSVPAIMEMMIDSTSSSVMNDIDYWQAGNLQEIELSCNNSLRLVMLSGDWIPLGLPDNIVDEFPMAQVVSLGGATEASIWSIYYPISNVSEEWSSIPYGRPLENQEIYILNHELELCPIGVQGEIHIGGIGIAKGYLNDIEKTKAAFIEHPILGKLYKTGDYGRFLDDGNVEFLGRKDQQVKVSGYRIELGEIESCLRENILIKNAVIIEHKEEGRKSIMAFYVADREVSQDELRNHLSKKLPEYMIPHQFVLIDNIPLNVNGKVDKKQLELIAKTKVNDSKQCVPPRNEMDKLFVNMWSEILEVKSIGINTNLFELGANSSNIILFISRVNSELNIKIPINLVFKAQKIKDISDYASKVDSVKECFYDCMLLNKKRERNIFCFPPILSIGIVYKQLADKIEDYSVYSFNFIKSRNVIEEYVNMMIKIQQNGPYVLMGHSAGGNVAFEVAKELIRRGHEVSKIILIDSYYVDKLEKETVSTEYKKEFVNQVIGTLFSKFSNLTGYRDELKDFIGDKVEGYIEFLDGFVTDGMVASDIYFISSTGDSEEKSALRKYMDRWKEVSNKSFEKYQGYGEHDDMLVEGCVEKNAQIINGVLKR